MDSPSEFPLFWRGMAKDQRSRGLVRAGNVLIAIGAVQVLGATYFCWSGGMEGRLSPVAAVAAIWPVAALLLFLGSRMRRTPVSLAADDSVSE